MPFTHKQLTLHVAVCVLLHATTQHKVDVLAVLLIGVRALMIVNSIGVYVAVDATRETRLCVTSGHGAVDTFRMCFVVKCTLLNLESMIGKIVKTWLQHVPDRQLAEALTP